MKLLVAITSFNQREEKYLARVLSNYSSSFSDCDVNYVITTHYSPTIEFPNNTTHFITSSCDKPYMHCWANQSYINSNFKEYDYIINTDSDIMVSRSNLDYYISESKIMGEKYIPGFLTAEMPDSGSPYLISMNQPCWVNVTYKTGSYIVPMNKHSAGMICDTVRYEYSYSHSFAKSPVSHSLYNYNDVARTDIYINGDFTKLVNVSGSCLFQHLPNKYYRYHGWPMKRVNNTKWE